MLHRKTCQRLGIGCPRSDGEGRLRIDMDVCRSMYLSVVLVSFLG